MVQLLQRGLPERLGDRRARIVHEHIKLAERADGLVDRGLHGLGIGRIRLDRDRPAARAIDRLDNGGSSVRTLAVRDGDFGAIGGEPLGDGGAYAA